MKAIVNEIYGSPDVLELREVEKPTPKEDEVLVKVYAASLNPAEWHAMRAEIFLVRLEAGLRKPKNKMLPADIAGRVEAVGKNVQQFKPGDDVFGRSKIGGFGEYVSVPVNRLAHKPANLTFDEAAAVPLAAVTGLQGLRKGQIQARQKVLINGASGGIGTFTVQLAKSFGAEITGVCSTKNLEMVRSIGADHVIDYTREDLVQKGQHYDLIIDAVGNLTVSDYRQMLNSTGKGVVLGFDTFRQMLPLMFQGSLISMAGTKKIMVMNANVNDKDLEFMKDVIEAGKVVPVIDRCYPLVETPEAFRYLGKKHARGKVIITMGRNGNSR